MKKAGQDLSSQKDSQLELDKFNNDVLSPIATLISAGRNAIKGFQAAKAAKTAQLKSEQARHNKAQEREQARAKAKAKAPATQLLGKRGGITGSAIWSLAQTDMLAVPPYRCLDSDVFATPFVVRNCAASIAMGENEKLKMSTMVMRAGLLKSGQTRDQRPHQGVADLRADLLRECGPPAEKLGPGYAYIDSITTRQSTQSSKQVCHLVPPHAHALMTVTR